MSRLIIIGASGHGRVVADIARLNGYDEIVFLDNDSALRECGGYPVLGPDALAGGLEGELFIAIGEAATRKRLMDREEGRRFPILIHPGAIVARDVDIGEGTVLMAGAVVNPSARLGRGVIVNTAASIDHDCDVGDFCHVSVGAHLCGMVNVGEATWIGAGAIVKNNIDICGGCMIGAGAVVIDNIEEVGTYIGVPARKRHEDSDTCK